MALAEHTKQARIAVIVDAAERLIRAQAGTQFSMRALASEAGVSPATPFNLLGSKAKILEALFVRSFSLPQSDPFGPAESNALEYALQFCDRVMQRYADDAAFYRTLMVGLGPNFESLLAGIANWQVVLQVALQQGDLRAETPLRSLAEALEFALIGTMAFWVTGDLASARLASQVRFGVLATLFAFATPRAQRALQRHIESVTRALQRHGPVGASKPRR